VLDHGVKVAEGPPKEAFMIPEVMRTFLGVHDVRG
jgi:ABC-type branched-subunit amino acid transport system ATPase component